MNFKVKGKSRSDKCLNLSNSHQISILSKGDEDYFAHSGQLYKFDNYPGSKRRCGGQGDLLAGALATFYAWDGENPPGAANAASDLIRYASLIAFRERKRSMVCSDIIPKIQVAFESIHGE